MRVIVTGRKDGLLRVIDNVEQTSYMGDTYVINVPPLNLTQIPLTDDIMSIGCQDTSIDKIKQLNARWQKLKEWLELKMETCPNSEWYDFNEMMCEIQDLEKEFDVQ